MVKLLSDHITSSGLLRLGESQRRYPLCLLRALAPGNTARWPGPDATHKAWLPTFNRRTNILHSRQRHLAEPGRLSYLLLSIPMHIYDLANPHGPASYDEMKSALPAHFTEAWQTFHATPEAAQRHRNSSRHGSQAGLVFFLCNEGRR